MLNILITNHHLLEYTGSEILTYTLANALKRKGNNVTVYSRYVGKIQKYFNDSCIEIFSDINEIKNRQFDIAHIHHYINAIEVRFFFPKLPMVYLSQGVLPFLEQPPRFNLGIGKYLAISDEVKNNLIDKGVEFSDIYVIGNMVNGELFRPRTMIRKQPAKALIVSNRIDSCKAEIIKSACKFLGIEYRFVGNQYGVVTQSELSSLIDEADIVFSLGRGVIEAMMCARVPLVYDYLGGDGLVTPDNIFEIMECNFSGRKYRKQYNIDELVEEIRKYKQEYGCILENICRNRFSDDAVADKLQEIYKTIRLFDVSSGLRV